jgi:putative FmdB family regulatory protein
MVTYTYACGGCNNTFERRLPIGSRLRPRCPICKKGKFVRKTIGLLGISFRGEGFTKSVYDEDDHIAD